ncbi:uncharacterized protein LOC112639515 [Camponotus floridanus]|uniref:uncharacterized protein LOC112639515 n=1 Tax=Camponotus floridanus TaxID=104421 RepID=UPI000DC698B8|nr:uncharacterized protein LOC112639515 [Camponotus floridanus]
MKQLHCINMRISIVLLLFFYAEIVEVIGQDVIKIQTANSGILNTKSVMKIYNNGCECIKYHCGCCQFIEWDAVYLNGTLCANASYLDRDYGISITITYNHITIINETVTARDPPPICIGENIVGSVKIDICLQIYDIDVDYNGFHACFDILGKIMKLKVYKLELGCIGSMQHKEKQYINNINNITFNLLHLFLQKKHSISPPNVIMV